MTEQMKQMNEFDTKVTSLSEKYNLCVEEIYRYYDLALKCGVGKTQDETLGKVIEIMLCWGM